MIIAALPAKLIARRIPDGARAYHFNVIVSSFLILAALAFYTYPFSTPANPGQGSRFCLFYYFAGLPCPFCGVSRSAAALLYLEFRGAWALHPGGTLVAATLLLQLPVRALALWRGGRRMNRWFSPRRDQWFNLIIAAFCMAAWATRL